MKQSGTYKQLVGGKLSMPEGSPAAAEKILESNESAAHNNDNGQMTVAKRSYTVGLNSKIAKPITKSESKNRERNSDENDKLLYERDKKPGPRRIDPRRRKMLIDPLRTAYQVNRQDDNVSD